MIQAVHYCVDVNLTNDIRFRERCHSVVVTHAMKHIFQVTIYIDLYLSTAFVLAVYARIASMMDFIDDQMRRYDL